MPRSLLVVDGFAPGARALRSHFDGRFADPHRGDAGRFVWDWWHVPGQYTLLRTPAWLYFPRRTWAAFHQRLVWWGRRVLGCHDVSPPWLSCYVDGCRQELHADTPHGPWAFVYSLTPWEGRRFKGGETALLRDEALDWWANEQVGRGVERAGLFKEVEPRFNRLTVFDPRLPHGVNRVEGASDPREGRLVIHGWFVQPRPFVEGPLPTRELAARIEELTARIGPALASGLAIAGVLSFGFRVSAAGRVFGLQTLTDTTRAPREDERGRRALLRTLARAVEGLRFRKRARPSRVTLPFVFER